MLEEMDIETGWTAWHSSLARRFVNLHFGGWRGVTDTFLTMKDTYSWSDETTLPADARVVHKNNWEYHGLETYARQFHATAQYEVAYQHWLMAAALRRDNMKANGFNDTGHLKAIRFDLSNAAYNKALAEWQETGGDETLPIPEGFGLTQIKIDRMEQEALAQLDRADGHLPRE